MALTVNPTNDPPAASSEEYHTSEDTPLMIDAAAGLLANDSDPDGDPLQATMATGPTNGTLTLSADGSISYQTESNLNRTASFHDPARHCSIPSPDTISAPTRDPTHVAPQA